MLFQFISHPLFAAGFDWLEAILPLLFVLIWIIYQVVAVREYVSCASMVIDGSVEQEDAMGLNDDLKEKGFALLCVAYPKSDLHIIVGDEVEDNLYNNQFGKYQK